LYQWGKFPFALKLAKVLISISDFDTQGNNVGKNAKSKILIISLAKPLP